MTAWRLKALGGWPDEQQRLRVWKHINHAHAKNLLIFTDKQTGQPYISNFCLP